MKIFLSWSGDRSKAAAEAFKDWLPYLITTTEPWMSSADIQAGARWGADIQSNLEDTKFGILFVTSSNVVAPWLLFEAGAIAKTLKDTYVCPYLLNIESSEIPEGPLTQFQHKKSNKADTYELVKTINNAMGQEVEVSRLETAFDKWWPEIESKLGSLPDESNGEQNTPDQDDMIKEILNITRRLETHQTSKQIYLDPFVPSKSQLLGARYIPVMKQHPGFQEEQDPFVQADEGLADDRPDTEQ